MKKVKLFVLAALLLAVTLVLASCGRDDPKSLAKQIYDLGLDFSIGNLINPEKQAEQQKKLEAIQEKVSKLTEDEKKIYYEELIKFGGEDLGNIFENFGNIGNWLETGKGLLDMFR